LAGQDVKPGFFQSIGALAVRTGQSIGGFFESIGNFLKGLFVKETEPVQTQETTIETINTPVSEIAAPVSEIAATVNEIAAPVSETNDNAVAEAALEEVTKNTYAINVQNPARGRLLSQHDKVFESIANIESSGCNFMVVLGFAQLASGKNLTADEYKVLWAQAITNNYMGGDGYVSHPDEISDMALRMLGRNDIRLTYGWGSNTGTLIGYRIRVPYNDEFHFILGDTSGDIVYNPGGTDKGPMTLVGVYVHTRN
jgi:hypothetical protein